MVVGIGICVPLVGDIIIKTRILKSEGRLGKEVVVCFPGVLLLYTTCQFATGHGKRKAMSAVELYDAALMACQRTGIELSWSADETLLSPSWLV